jgi:nitrogen regulatory protein P-II 1
MYLIFLVLDNPSMLDEVLTGWTEAGVSGVTVIESTGVQRLRERAVEQTVPMFLGFSRLLRSDQYNHYTLLSVIPDMAAAQRVVDATQDVVGDLSQPHTGILFVVPVSGVWGLPELECETSSEPE